MFTPNKASDLALEVDIEHPDRSWIVDYLRRQRAWSQRTFGCGPRTGGLIKHIEKELEEIKANPSNVDEWLDVAILALDGAWRAGHTPERVAARLVDLQRRNMARTYPMPASDDEPSEHLRSESQSCPHYDYYNRRCHNGNPCFQGVGGKLWRECEEYKRLVAIAELTSEG